MTLVSSNPQILEMKIHGVDKSPTRISEIKWRDVIYNERG